jgi:hypothetical protein
LDGNVVGWTPDGHPGGGGGGRAQSAPYGRPFPEDDGINWDNEGYYIKSDTHGSWEWFCAPVVFPTGQAVVVESITLYAYDDNGSDNVCAYLSRTDLAAGSQMTMGSICSTGASASVRHFTESTISGNPLKHGKGIYLSLAIQDDTDLYAYGVRIQYHHGTT